VIFLAGTIREIAKIFHELKGAKTKRENGVVIVYMDNDLPTSSFFNYLFVPKSELLNPMEYEHELAHIKQWHSLDKLLLCILRAIFWFNPVIYFYKKSLDEIHEYLADQAVLDRNSTTDYLDFLRDKIERRYQYALINPFYSLIKNRLTMINKNVRSSRKIFLMATPLCFLLFGLFSCDEYITAQSSPDLNTRKKVKELTIINSTIQDIGDPTEYLLYKDTVTIFDENTYEETIQIIDVFGSKEEYEAHQYAIENDRRIFIYNSSDEMIHGNYIFHVPVEDYLKESQWLSEENENFYYEIKENGVTVEKSKLLTKVIDENLPDKKHLLYKDTITIFNKDTYEETVTVIEVRDTKEVYVAYQEALALERYIFLRNINATGSDCGGTLFYTDISDYLKNTAIDCMNKNGTYIYEIYEKNILVETSDPFTLVDIRE